MSQQVTQQPGVVQIRQTGPGPVQDQQQIRMIIQQRPAGPGQTSVQLIQGKDKADADVVGEPKKSGVQESRQLAAGLPNLGARLADRARVQSVPLVLAGVPPKAGLGAPGAVVRVVHHVGSLQRSPSAPALNAGMASVDDAQKHSHVEDVASECLSALLVPLVSSLWTLLPLFLSPFVAF